jgi:hypothetical protein
MWRDGAESPFGIGVEKIFGDVAVAFEDIVSA